MPNATLKRTMALVPIADLEEMCHRLHEYIDLLDGMPADDTQAVDEMREAELLIAKIRPHAGKAFSNVGGRLASAKTISQYEQYCINYEKETNEMWGASSMPAPDKPLRYSEWFNAGRPYNHPDHQN